MSLRARRGVVTSGVLLAALVWVTPAFAGAWWRLSSRAAPTNLAPGSQGLIDVDAQDLGDTGVNASSSHVRIGDTLPAGLAVAGGAAAIKAHRSDRGNNGSISPEEEETKFWKCELAANREVECETLLTIPAYETLELEIPVEATDPAGTVASPANEVSVQGGEADDGGLVPRVTLTRPIRISDEPVAFGLEENGYTITAENGEGEPDIQAGSHPYQLTSTVYLNQTLEEVQLPGEKPVLAPAAPALSKDLSFNLPPGLLGNVNATEQCPEVNFDALEINGRNSCPAGSTIGVATVTANEPHNAGYFTLAVPVFNLQPAHGEPARFGFEAEKIPVFLDTSVRTGGDYGVTVSVSNTTEAAQVLGAQVTLWGDPDNESHDQSRGWACLLGGVYVNREQPCQPPEPRSSVPFLTLPSACVGTVATFMQGESWTGEQLQGEYTFQNAVGGALEAFEECSALPFKPSLRVQPEQQAEEGLPQEQTTAASTPTGLDADVEVAQQGTLTEGQPADADVKTATVTLPPGMLLNPGAANGLEACSETQIGYLGFGAASDPLSPGAPEPLRFSSAKAACPPASKVGTVSIRTPLLGEELHGSVYLASPAPNGEAAQNPFNSLLALYILAESETLGLRVKLAGQATLDQQTGQITTVFENTPQVPFEALQLRLFGGPHGSLTTPSLCGTYSATTSFTAWSGASGAPPSEPPFQITSGPGGGACPATQLPFAPAFHAGSTSDQAGALTDFDLQLDDPDGDQPLSGLSMHLPAGVAALLAHVTPCPEPQAAESQCGPESLIGQSVASAGLGPDPIQLPGDVYLTGPYQGAPFGLSVVTPAVAGPFNLGDVTVRSRIDVNPHTAQVTIISDPFPTFVKGVPVDLKRIQVEVNRPNFEYNPTSCNPMSIEGALTGSDGASTNVSSPFQVAGCQALPFKPGVTATTDGKTSKADGASLGLKFKSTGGEAHVAKTILTIPATLPARLTTIQKACVASVFEANPAGCPEGSDIGTATVHTPVLKSPLTGPIYLVSHGNAAWPDAELVLQGEGITVILDGQTAIKKGVTTSSFLSVPDAPFESVEATLPEGPHSALTTNLPLEDHYSLCGQHLTIPAALTGQNAAAIDDTVKVTVQGCTAVNASKAKNLTKAQKLKRALAVCRNTHRHSHTQRARCERKARNRYAVRGKAHKAASFHAHPGGWPRVGSGRLVSG